MPETTHSTDSSKQACGENENKAMAGATRSRSRKEKRGAREIEAETEVGRASKRRISGLESYLNINVNVTEVLDITSKCIDFPEEGPDF